MMHVECLTDAIRLDLAQGGLSWREAEKYKRLTAQKGPALRVPSLGAGTGHSVPVAQNRVDAGFWALLSPSLSI